MRAFVRFRCVGWVASIVWLGGCSLLTDLDDYEVRKDAAIPDASAYDAAVSDGSLSRDASRDGGPADLDAGVDAGDGLGEMVRACSGRPGEGLELEITEEGEFAEGEDNLLFNGDYVEMPAGSSQITSNAPRAGQRSRFFDLDNNDSPASRKIAVLGPTRLSKPKALTTRFYGLSLWASISRADGERTVLFEWVDTVNEYRIEIGVRDGQWEMWRVRDGEILAPEPLAGFKNESWQDFVVRIYWGTGGLGHVTVWTKSASDDVYSRRFSAFGKSMAATSDIHLRWGPSRQSWPDPRVLDYVSERADEIRVAKTFADAEPDCP